MVLEYSSTEYSSTYSITRAENPRCCCNAASSASASIGTPERRRLLGQWQGLPCPYFNQRRAWSDTATMAKWWRDVFLPFVRLHLAMRPVLLIMDNCGSHASDRRKAQGALQGRQGLGGRGPAAAEHDPRVAADGRRHHRLREVHLQVVRALDHPGLVRRLGQPA